MDSDPWGSSSDLDDSKTSRLPPSTPTQQHHIHSGSSLLAGISSAAAAASSVASHSSSSASASSALAGMAAAGGGVVGEDPSLAAWGAPTVAAAAASTATTATTAIIPPAWNLPDSPTTHSTGGADITTSTTASTPHLHDPLSARLAALDMSASPSSVNANATTTTTTIDSKFDWFVTEEKILISISPEKVGMVFKHTNYVVQLESRNSTTLRRYSDFVWLLDMLVKKYPFRILPNLPPKKVGPDEIFLEQRRRALSRFLNFIYNHPVLRTDDTVLAFLTIDSDIQTYRKSVTNSIIDEEYLTAEITDAMLARIPDNFDDVILKFKKSIVELTDYFRAFASLMEKVVRRIDANSMDFMTYCNILKKIPDCNDCTKIECFKCSSLNIGCGRLADCFSDAAKVYEKQAENVYDGAIEGLKAFRDLLIALQELLARREKSLQQISIETLQKRIMATQEKIRNDTYTQKEVDKLVFQVEQDQKEILLCIKKQKFIRYCTWFELQFYHRKKVTLSTLYQSYAGEQLRSQVEFADIWKTFSECARELPTVGF